MTKIYSFGVETDFLESTGGSRSQFGTHAPRRSEEHGLRGQLIEVRDILEALPQGSLLVGVEDRVADEGTEEVVLFYGLESARDEHKYEKAEEAPSSRPAKQHTDETTHGLFQVSGQARSLSNLKSHEPQFNVSPDAMLC